jgi:isopentenyl-diphosphate delta-isomerase type 1
VANDIEYVDIYDENMKHIGTMEKVEAHAKFQWHKAVSIWVTDGENVLLQLRAKQKRLYPNLWEASVSGHLIVGETPIQAAMREYREEIGIDWDYGNIKENCVFTLDKMADGGIGHEFQYMYFLKKKIDISKLKLQESEVADVKWVPFNEFQKLFASKDFVPHRKDFQEMVIKGLSKL